MARVVNTAKQALSPTIDYIHNRVNDVDRFFDESNQTDPPLDTTYKNGRQPAYVVEAKNLVRMIRWYMTKYNITIPIAFTDAQVDAIDPDIRTHEE